MKLTPALIDLLGEDISLTPPSWPHFAVHNPSTGDVLAYVREMTAADTEAAIAVAEKAMPAWAALTAKARAKVMEAWYAVIMKHQEALGLLVSLEQGRAIKEARGEVAYAAGFIEWFAEEGKRAYGRTIPATADGKQLLTISQPVGVVGAITPWNFPLSMITRKLGPALAAGCAAVVKPSEDTPICAIALKRLAKDAGVPDGLIAIITTTHSADIGAVLTSDARIKKFSFTGSTPVGKKLYAQCATTVKKISLELGGNAPVVVFDDADLDLAVAGAAASKFRNSGQTCVCANRIFVQRGIYDAFVERFVAEAAKLKSGPGYEESTGLGPLINQKAIDKVVRLVEDAVSKGARIALGGQVDAQGPLYYPATVLTGVTRDMQMFEEEIFGPVAALYPFDTEEEGIALANDTPFGLAAYAFTQDITRGLRVVKAIEAGMVGLNDGVMSTEVAPFGGVKESGIGREGATEGLEEFLETKFISIAGLG
ncbi:NAD-dependent succinate-semialdehyde dehydrogenase [Asticcacaulis sp. BYS171W]|uniref:NAD-dependent succinate-semialdehyde dehydrogenase n=1 Tax=Asticcacaulis aquaticus TaxID=2984212 RepID=A0ABT5HQM1_9CAUL|nr:NAD-dependent succinate-semialdehyde dehydrogenase [Asticcacaulis aquaticus]MDC7682284.1 NAD-dependent succinate-semialdehyde dehydrogenase [Asticcacaulis aquaticus]